MKNNDPLHGITLEDILFILEDHYGWEGLSTRIDIRCFNQDPSIKSSLKFLRKTPWARSKVEQLYIEMVKCNEAPPLNKPKIKKKPKTGHKSKVVGHSTTPVLSKPPTIEKIEPKTVKQPEKQNLDPSKFSFRT